jgi:peptide/nickel transport system permease protein
LTSPSQTEQFDPEQAETPDLPVARRQREWLQTPKAAWKLRRTKIGVAFLVFVFVIAIFGPMLAPHSPTEFVGASFQLPSRVATLGTDYLGRDVLSRVLYGGRTTLVLALVATFIGEFFGLLLGLIAAYSRRGVDETVMRLLDVVLAFPAIIFALLIVSVAGPNPWLIVVAVGFTHIPAVARVSRGVALRIVNLDFVKAAEALGMPKLSIMWSEILPNITTPVLVDSGIRFAYSISIIAALSFLGFGLQPPLADWGLMINENRIGISAQPYALLAPILMIAIATIGANLVSDGMSRAIIGLDRKMANQ